MASYPSSLPSLSNPNASDKTNNPSHASQHGNANDEIEAIATELGTDVAGTKTDLKTYLVVEHSTDGTHTAVTCTSVAASGGSIVLVQQTTTGAVGTTAIDWTAGNKMKFTFGAGNETLTFTAPAQACNLTLMLVQDGVGSRTLTYPGTVKWSDGTKPTLTTTAAGIDILSFYFDGTSYHGQAGFGFAVPA